MATMPLNDLRLMAKAGDPNAHFRLGAAYYCGDGGAPKDLVKAREEFEKASSLGIVEAMVDLGFLFQHGEGTTLQLDKALEWYGRAADKGNSRAMTNLGYMHYHGLGTKKDLNRAKQLFEQAAAIGNSNALFNLGRMYQMGEGIPKDLSKAKAYFEKAIADGHDLAMTSLAYMLQVGDGADAKHIHKAVKFYEKAISKGNSIAMNNLATMLYKGETVPRDLKKAVELYERAISLGNADAMNNLANMHERGECGTIPDFQKAIDLYENAISKGNAAAMNNLALLYFHRMRTSENAEKAKGLFERAASNGNSDAMCNLAIMYEKGDALFPKNPSKSLDLFANAASKGHPVAKKRHDELKAKIPSETPQKSSGLPPKQPKQESKVMDDFEIVKKLGQGGFGSVLLVNHRKQKKKFAMKVIPCKDINKLNTALSEAFSMKLDHPSIVGLENCFLGDIPSEFTNEPDETDSPTVQCACIVLELCEKGDLRKEICRLLREGCKAEERDVWRWLRQSCSALNYLHSKNQIHRDIKPENLVLTSDDPPNVKLTDFGISRKLRNERDVAMTPAGTNRYCAPEMMYGKGFGFNADAWGIGLVFYELLTRGVLLFGPGEVPKAKALKSNFDSTFYHVRAKKPGFIENVRMSIIENGFSAELANVVCKLLEQDPAKRMTVLEALNIARTHDSSSDDSDPVSPLSRQMNGLATGGGSSSPVTTKNYIIPYQELEFVKKLGKGGFGDVWQAKWNERGGGSVVAVKKLRSGASNHSQSETPSSGALLSAGARASFENEVATMESLHFGHVVRIFGACIDPASPLCIVEEYVKRGSLFDVLQDQSITLEWPLRLKMANHATLGLNYLHKCDPPIVHCDVKSPNFLVTSNWELKICDFGLAKIRLSRAADSSSNPGEEDDASLVASSPRWGAPETLRPQPVWDQKSDVYSLGMTYLELACRHIPFLGLDNHEVRAKVIAGELPAIPSECPDFLRILIGWCCEFEPGDRPTCKVILDQMSKQEDFNE